MSRRDFSVYGLSGKMATPLPPNLLIYCAFSYSLWVLVIGVGKGVRNFKSDPVRPLV